jgi:hypothetical protein
MTVTKQVGVVVTLKTCIREVLGSKLATHFFAGRSLVGWGGGILENLCSNIELNLNLNMSEIGCLISCTCKILIDLLIDRNLKCSDFKH